MRIRALLAYLIMAPSVVAVVLFQVFMCLLGCVALYSSIIVAIRFWFGSS